MQDQKSTSASIIVRLPNWVGDVCMALPCLGRLQAEGYKLVVCARPWAKDLLLSLGLPALDSLQFVPLTGRFIADYRAVRQARSSGERGAKGLVLPDSLSSAALFWLNGIPSAGYRDDGRSLLLRWPFQKPTAPLHASQKWLHLTEQALAVWQGSSALQGMPNVPNVPNVPKKPKGLELTPSNDATAIARRALANASIKTDNYVLLAPTATGLHRGQVKVWPHFRELAQNLIRAGYTVVTCPPPNEREQARQTIPEAVMLDAMTLSGFAALAKGAGLVICNDSGVSHLAALVRARQLTLFGVTDPALTGPLSETAMSLGGVARWPSLEEVTRAALAQLTQT